jgi:hypothetical protein
MKNLIKSTLLASVLALLVWAVSWFFEASPSLFLVCVLCVVLIGFLTLLKDYRALETS